MKKFTVSIPEVHYNIVEVELPDDVSREQICDVARLAAESGDSLNVEYGHTLSRDLWQIEGID